MPLVTRGVATRQPAGATEVGLSRRRTAHEAGGGVANRRRVVVSRVPRAADRATSVVRVVGNPVAMRVEMTVVRRQIVSRVVARRRDTADTGRRRRGTVLTQAEVRWLTGGLLPVSPLGR
jgi:hypothetical protein